MNMTPKGYIFCDPYGEEISRVTASSLTEATGKINCDYDRYEVHDLYHVVNITPEGNKILGSYWNVDVADDAADEQSECYQNAHIEVMYKGEVI
jgi:hypothetical protein